MIPRRHRSASRHRRPAQQTVTVLLDHERAELVNGGRSTRLATKSTSPPYKITIPITPYSQPAEGRGCGGACRSHRPDSTNATEARVCDALVDDCLGRRRTSSVAGRGQTRAHGRDSGDTCVPASARSRGDSCKPLQHAKTRSRSTPSETRPGRPRTDASTKCSHSRRSGSDVREREMETIPPLRVMLLTVSRGRPVEALVVDSDCLEGHVVEGRPPSRGRRR